LSLSRVGCRAVISVGFRPWQLGQCENPACPRGRPFREPGQRSADAGARRGCRRVVAAASDRARRGSAPSAASPWGDRVPDTSCPGRWCRV